MINLNDKDMRHINVMNLLGDPTRYKIFKLLLTSKDLCVTEIAEKLEVSVPAVSQHFRIFEMLGIVDKNRHGQKICYVIKKDDQFIAKLTQAINN